MITSSSAGMPRQVFPIDPASYVRHAIHASDRAWAETNCYVDVWVELLHAWGFEPIAALPFTLAIDFEGDQWTFFKFPLVDLGELFQLDVQELAIWRPLTSHLAEQIELGRPVLVELDSYYLPDTVGTAYRMEHVKSTVAAVQIDVENRRLGYFHGQGYYHLEGEDFTQVLRATESPDPAALPPYVEFVKRRSSPAPRGAALLETSLRLLRRQMEWLPESNPFPRFKRRFEVDLTWLAQESLDTFHKYSFATLRQFGACYELAATYLQWLHDQQAADLRSPIADLLQLSAGAKTMQFTLARAMTRKKPLDLAPFDAMAERWQNAIDCLRTTFASPAASV